MPRRFRSSDYSEDDSGMRGSSKRRARAAVSYIEDSDDDDLGAPTKKPTDPETGSRFQNADEDFGHSASDTTLANGNLDDEYMVTEEDPRKQQQQRQRQHQREKVRGERSDDSDFKAESVSDPDEDLSDEYEEDQSYMEKLREKQFIATDDEDGDDGGYYLKKKSRRKPKRSSRLSEPRPRKRAINSDSDDILGGNDDANNDTIQQEIQDLYDLLPDASPMKHKLREREKRIDYTIPSLLTVENEAELYAQAVPAQPLFAGRGRKPLGSKSAFRKLLFPTAGPFGGLDVQLILGQNIPPGGIPVIGKGIGPSDIAFGVELDSSDDEIVGGSLALVGIPEVPKPSTTASAVGTLAIAAGSTNVVGHTTVVGAQAVDKRKNNLSDTDPLGVDMNIDFLAVGGLDNYIDQLKEMVALPLLYPELYQNFQITPPRGVLFHGPPGTGKTLMARALAASCLTPTQKITFFMRKGADCLSKWVGEAERQLRLLFEEAKNQQPAIIFFDEIDGLAPVRLSKQEQIHASIVSTLLALMDGMDNRGQVVVIGATNRPDSIDPALRRPGRFDREFYFPLPDLSSRRLILSIHTKKWTPKLPPVFLDKIATLTKGYGGADLRALCTEAALNSIQRKYPQIYQSSTKLQINPTKVRVVAKDFIRAIEKIVPSSARSAFVSSAPLPPRVQPLLQHSVDQIFRRLAELLPGYVGLSKIKLTALNEAHYADPSVHDLDGGFARHELLRTLEAARVCRPYLLVCGPPGAGQQYVGAAILNMLEGFQAQNLDLAAAFGDTLRTPELYLVQTFSEARRHQPLIIYISNIDTWFAVMPPTARAILGGLLRSLRSTEKILLMGIADCPYEDLDPEITLMLGALDALSHIALVSPGRDARVKFFSALQTALFMKPYEFINDLQNCPKRKLLTLKPAPIATETINVTKRQAKEQKYMDKKLKNVLKIKLAGMLDLFKNRYKRFKKPIIDDGLLHHLFEPSVLTNPLVRYEVAFVISKDPDHPNMIQELATGNFFYNMDLDTIEERVWNGYYSEATQFLKDVNMIVKDAKTAGDRDRILKAKEMFTNAQFAVDEINNPEFAKACREVRERELKKQEKLLAAYEKLREQMKKDEEEKLRQNGVMDSKDIKMEELSSTALLENGHSEILPVVRLDVKEKAIDTDLEKMEVANETVTETEKRTEIEEAEAVKIETEAMALMSGEVVRSAEIEIPQETIEPSPVEEQDESESEAEIVVPEKELVIPADAHTLLKDEIADATEEFTVDELEQVLAKLMEIIWNDRNKWDKTDTVARLRQVVKCVRA